MIVHVSHLFWHFMQKCEVVDQTTLLGATEEVKQSCTGCSASVPCPPDVYIRRALSWVSLFAGARVLRQDPVECLFQFVCSSNNHISRIHGMVERLCRAYGTPLPVMDKAAAADLPEVSGPELHAVLPNHAWPNHSTSCRMSWCPRGTLHSTAAESFP